MATPRKNAAPTRTHHEVNPESRVDRSETVDAARSFSEDEMRQMIRNEFVQEALPQVPDRGDWHFCWLSTTAGHDPLHKRMRLGYEVAHLSDVAGLGLDAYKSATGDYAGGVVCNEMVLFKIRRERYQMIMEEFHHNIPLENEQAIKAAMPDKKDKSGKKLVDLDPEDEGFTQLGEERQAPVFT